MQRLLACLFAVGLFAAACGSESESEPAATGTQTSQRVERQATVSEQEQQQDVDVAVADEPAQLEQQAETPAEQAQVEQARADQAQTAESQAEQQIDAPPDDGADQQLVVLPEEIVGEHKGVRSERNVLGDPDSAIEILYYGDFT